MIKTLILIQNNMMKKILTLVIIICVSIGYASAYSFYINGSITDDSGNPVIGQEVIVYTLSLFNELNTFKGKYM